MDTMRQIFEAWAEEHLGQGYSLEMEDGSYKDVVTRWAFVSHKAAHKAQQVIIDQLKAELEDRSRTKW